MRKKVSRTFWTKEQKQQAAIEYAVTGTFTAVERALGIPNETVCRWSKEDWWGELVAKVNDEKGEEHRARYVKIVDKAQKQTLKKLPNANAAQANLIACQATDKIRLHDGLATSITGKAVTSEDLLNKFAAIAKEYNRKVVSEQ